MKIIKIIILTILPMCFAFAQNELVDIKAAIACDNGNKDTHQIDILIKANNANDIIRVAEQNYRFAFNKSTLQNPRILEEGTAFSEIILDDQDFSVYSPHTLRGSNDSIVSYNIELAGGVGTLLNESEWRKVGTLEFDVIDQSGSKEITWFGKDVFPSTTFIKKEGQSLIEIKTNFYPTEIIGGDPTLASAFERSWQHPCLANEGWLKLDWSDVDDEDELYISIDGGLNYSTVASSSNQFLATNLNASDYDIRIKLSENGCPVVLDDINLVNFGFDATFESGYNCEENKGFITVNWTPSPYTNVIKISTSGGKDYLTVNDELGTYTFNDLRSGDYNVKVLNNNGSCLTDVGLARLVSDVDAPIITRGWLHTDCGQSNGELTLSWMNNPNVEQIQISTDGGNSYETIPDALQYYSVDDLGVGDYDIWVKWGAEQDACPIQLDDINLINRAPANTGLEMLYTCTEQKMRLQDSDYVDADFREFSYRILDNSNDWSDWITTGPMQSEFLEIPVSVENISNIQYRFKVQCDGATSLWSAPKTSAKLQCKLSNADSFFEIAAVPNPFSNRFQINISNNQFKAQKGRIELTNLLGKIIYTKAINLTEGKTSFNIEPSSSISTGVYFANIELDNGTKQTIKLLKK